MKESFYEAIERVYGHDAVAIIQKLLEVGGGDEAH